MVCQYFPTLRPSATLNFKNFNIWSCDCHCGPNVMLCTEFHRNWFTHSASRRPKLQYVQCAVGRQRPLPWQPNRGGHVGDMMGCAHPSCFPVTAWKITRLPRPFLFATGVKGGSRKTSMRNRKWKSGRFVSLRLLWWKPLNKQYELFYINRPTNYRRMP